VLASAAAKADPVTISGTQTTPVLTSTANSGAPSDVSITGSITPTSGTAVTIDSSNSVTNSGTITITDADNSAGIVANPGLTGSITNSGTITISESYTQTDTNGDGVLDGIQTLGALTGDITNSGTIVVHGNESAGIALGGTLTGSLSQSGTITVVGDNSVGVSAQGVTGSVNIAGTISATGANASAVLLNGDIGGALTIQATATATSYTDTTLPASTASLGADNLLQGGPAVQVAGNVAGGILVTAATSTTDSSGNAVTTTAADILSFGSSPALLIGSATRDITIGPIASDSSGHGLVVAGAVTAEGVYSGFTTQALVIGGLGGTVNIAGGASITGFVEATSNAASSTGFEIGSGATVPSVTNSGTISATSSGAVGDVTAFIDKSGSVTQFTNSGIIAATGGASNVAIDLSAATSAVTVTQASTTGTPTITGDIRFGSGADTLAVSAGTVVGNVSFGGAGTVALSGSGSLSGNIDFDNAQGASLSVATGASYQGALLNAGGASLAVNGGTLTASGAGASVASLSVTNGGTLGVLVDGNGVNTLYHVSGTASFGTGSLLALHFTDINHVVGTYDVVEAGTLTGAGNVAINSTSLPFLYDATLSTNTAGSALDVAVTRKTAAELGLNRADSAAYEPVIAAISNDSAIGDSFLSLDNLASFKTALRSLMPDYAGGAFDTVSLASRTSMRWLADPTAPVYGNGPWGAWIHEIGWSQTKPTTDGADGYRTTGWGLAGGGEYALGKLGRFGLSASFTPGTIREAGSQNEVTDEQYEFGAYWRATWGGFHAYARGSYATINFKSTRIFSGNDDGTAVSRTAIGRWNGKLLSGAGGVSYQLSFGAFTLRPQASFDYYRLHENGYSDTGGGVGMDLTVDPRRSTELAATELLAASYRLMGAESDEDGYLRVELEGGRREHLSGSLGDTTASFAGGESFSLAADPRDSGWTGAARLKGGNGEFAASGEVDAEREQRSTAIAFRVGVQAGF
jgi:hypothetical protein